jgi:hypothetical protein
MQSCGESSGSTTRTPDRSPASAEEAHGGNAGQNHLLVLGPCAKDTPGLTNGPLERTRTVDSNRSSKPKLAPQKRGPKPKPVALKRSKTVPVKGKRISIQWAADDDPIYQNGWNVFMPHKSDAGSKTSSGGTPPKPSWPTVAINPWHPPVTGVH